MSLYHATFFFFYSTGFTSSDCSVNIDECDGNTCPTNSVCVDDIGTYKCACQNGKIGEDCQKGGLLLSALFSYKNINPHHAACKFSTITQTNLNSLPNDKILDLSKLQHLQTTI